MATITDLSPPASPPEPMPTPPRTAGRSRTGVWAPLVRLHFYAGVLVAPFLLIAALTGLAYAFTPQLDELIYHDELHVAQVTGTPHSLVDQVAAARAAHPEGAIASVIPPAEPDATTQVVLAVPELGESQRTVYVDQYSNEVRGALTTSWGSTPAKTWLSGLHASLNMGEPGRLYSELAASWLWVLAGGGLLMWLVRRRQYRGAKSLRAAVLPDLSARGVRRTRGWHASVGVWITVGLFFLSATGLTWSTYAGERFDVLRTALKSDAPTLDTAVPGAAPATGGGHGDHGGSGTPKATALPAGVSIDQVLSNARSAGLTGPVTLKVPATDKSTWSVAQTDNTWPVRLDQAAIDPATGNVTDRARWADYPVLAKLSKLGVQAHMGRLFGLANQLLLAALALGLVCVIVWGYRMWWQRRPTRDGQRRPVGKAPARGTWRQVPLPVLLIAVPVVVAVGWAIPVLGVSLVGFLVLDAVVGAVDRVRRRGKQEPTPAEWPREEVRA